VSSNKLTPIRHPTLENHHRVPVIKFDNKYEIYLSDNFVKIYEEGELPDPIKTQMAMVRAGTRGLVTETPSLSASVYECPKVDSHLADVGWQPCEGLYVLVLPTKYLTYMEEQVYNAALTYRRVDGVGFIASDRPTFRTLEDYEQWLHLGFIASDRPTF